MKRGSQLVPALRELIRKTDQLIRLVDQFPADQLPAEAVQEQGTFLCQSLRQYFDAIKDFASSKCKRHLLNAIVYYTVAVAIMAQATRFKIPGKFAHRQTWGAFKWNIDKALFEIDCALACLVPNPNGPKGPGQRSRFLRGMRSHTNQLLKDGRRRARTHGIEFWFDGDSTRELPIAVIGNFGTGKSTLVNALLGDLIEEEYKAPTGGYEAAVHAQALALDRLTLEMSRATASDRQSARDPMWLFDGKANDVPEWIRPLPVFDEKLETHLFVGCIVAGNPSHIEALHSLVCRADDIPYLVYGADRFLEFKRRQEAESVRSGLVSLFDGLAFFEMELCCISTEPITTLSDAILVLPDTQRNWREEYFADLFRSGKRTSAFDLTKRNRHVTPERVVTQSHWGEVVQLDFAGGGPRGCVLLSILSSREILALQWLRAMGVFETTELRAVDSEPLRRRWMNGLVEFCLWDNAKIVFKIKEDDALEWQRVSAAPTRFTGRAGALDVERRENDKLAYEAKRCKASDLRLMPEALSRHSAQAATLNALLCEVARPHKPRWFGICVKTYGTQGCVIHRAHSSPGRERGRSRYLGRRFRVAKTSRGISGVCRRPGTGEFMRSGSAELHKRSDRMDLCLFEEVFNG